MNVPIRVSAEAVAELAGLVEFYESKDVGLGARFKATFLRNLGYGERFPRIGPTYYRDLRKLLLRPFKVWLIYRVNPTHIKVAAIVDARRSNRSIKRVLRGR